MARPRFSATAALLLARANDLAARALSAETGIAADYFDATLTRPVPEGTLAGGK